MNKRQLDTRINQYDFDPYVTQVVGFQSIHHTNMHLSQTSWYKSYKIQKLSNIS